MINDFLTKLKELGFFIVFPIAIACFLALLIVLKLFERPTKYFCEYILREERSLQAREDRIYPVEACISEIKPMIKRIATTGNLRANNSVSLKAELNAPKIKKIHFEPGAAVKQGDLLIEFEDDDYVARVSSASAEVEMRDLEFKRISQLYAQKVESQKKFDEAKANLSVAKGRLEEAQANLKKTKIYAPFEGVAGLINYSEGATVNANDTLVKLVDETPMKIEFSIPESYIHDIGVGQTVEVKVDAFHGRSFEGVIEAVDSAITKETHSIRVLGTLSNEEGQLREGLFCHINVITGEKSDVLQIDETAIQLYQDKEIVFIVEKGRARAVPVITGFRENGRVEIKTGLQPGMIVITAGQVRGMNEKVKVTNLSTQDLVSDALDRSTSIDGSLEKSESTAPIQEAQTQTDTPENNQSQQ